MIGGARSRKIAPAMGNEPQTGPTQAQNQSINNQPQFTVNIATSNPELERRIFSGVHSPGRQLARMADVLEALITAVPAVVQSPEGSQAVADFRSMQADIDREKRRGDPRYVVEQLKELQGREPQTFATVISELRSWLNSLPTG